MFRLLLRFRPKKKKNILFIYSLTVIIIFSSLAGAFAVPAFALPPALLKARTIGELIVTLFAGAGTAISNPVVVPAIYSNYSTTDYSLENMVNEGLIYDPSGQMTKAEIIESLGTQEIGTPRALNLDSDGFRELMSTNWQEMTDTGIDAVMRFNNIANTDSVYGAIDNLGQLFLDVANYGYLGAENMIAIVANPGTTVQVAFENIKDAILAKYQQNIDMGYPIQTSIPETALNDGYKFGYYSVNQRTAIPFFTSGGDPILVINKGAETKHEYQAYIINMGSGTVTVWSNRQSPVPYYTIPENKGIYSPISYLQNWDRFNLVGENNGPITGYGNSFTVYSDAEFQQLFNQLRSGDVTVPGKYSPDLINQQQGNIYNPIEVLPNLTDQGLLQIIPKDDYVDLIDVLNNNTDNGDPENNALVLDNFLDEYLTLVDDPGTNEPGENPGQPIQPTLIPRPTNTPEETTDVLNALSTPGLQTVFPFCLPFDLDYLFRKFMAEPKTPRIVIPFKIQRFGIDEEIILDFAMFDNVASLLRKLMVIAYIGFLIFETRNIIGA